MNDTPSQKKGGRRKSDCKQGVMSGGGKGEKVPPKTRYSSDKPHPVQWKNDRFEQFYKRLVPEHEWDKFITTLREPLPITFWINPLEYTQQTIEKMENYEKAFHNLSIDGASVSFEPLPFFPGKLAWQCVLPKAVLRRNPKFTEFHRWLIGVTLQGLVNRQEAVSMLPPLFMDVKPEHFVMDMCAAPGSKSAQLLHSLGYDVNSCGLLIANDADYGRAELLVHQIKRFSKLFPAFLCVNHDARYFSNRLNEKVEVKFDRILCDVMCSGDGTLRKSPNSWRSWSVSQALSMSKKQRMVLRRAVEMLKVGGRIVYSTCSMNPIENEAVISYVLRRYPGSLRLLDMSRSHPEVERNPGLSTWIVPDSHGDLHEIAPSAQEMKEKKYLRGLKRHIFPPDAAEAEVFNLEYCMRFWPHTQNTGGFFIAALEKTQEVVESRKPTTKFNVEEGSEKETSDEEKDRSVAGPSMTDTLSLPKRVKRGEQTERYRYEKLSAEMVAQLASFYQCEGLPEDRLYFRCVDSATAATATPTVVLLVCQAIANLLDVPEIHKQWNIVNCGLPLFEWDRMQSRESSTIGENYRVKQQSCEYIAALMHKSNRLIVFDPEFVISLLKSPMKRIQLPVELESLPVGGVVITCTGSQGKVFIAGMRARGSLNAMVADEDVDQLLELLGAKRELTEETGEQPSKKMKSAND